MSASFLNLFGGHLTLVRKVGTSDLRFGPFGR
jgi:hypothetical protein